LANLWKKAETAGFAGNKASDVVKTFMARPGRNEEDEDFEILLKKDQVARTRLQDPKSRPRLNLL